MPSFEEKMNEWLRRGATDRVKWFNALPKTMLPSQIKRIQQNDKSVLTELVVPKWVSWDMLFEWSNTKIVKEEGVRRCILCDKLEEFGITFNQKFVCQTCFLKLKHVDETIKEAEEFDLSSFAKQSRPEP